VRLLDLLRRHMRDRGYAWKTEKTYIHWIRRFLRFHGLRHPDSLSAVHVEQYLSHLANERHCSPATQRIVLNSLVYLFTKFLGIELEGLDYNKATPHRRLPVVLTHPEVLQILEHLGDKHRLMVELLYGSGLRLNELLSLRIKDLDFHLKIITVRSGKGDKDRVTLLPTSLEPRLRQQIADVAGKPYAELHCLSCFSFLRSASRPEELVAQASANGYAGLAITDECSLAGVVKAHVAAKEHGTSPDHRQRVQPHRRHPPGGPGTDARGLCRALGTDQPGPAAQPQGRVPLPLRDVIFHLKRCLLIWLPRDDDESSRAYGRQLARLCRGRVWIGVHYLLGNDELRRYRALQALGRQPRPAPGRLRRRADALRLAQAPARRDERPAPQLQCRRTRQPPPAQRPAAPAQPGAAARLYPPELLAETQRIARRCRFSLDELRYEYPEEVVPEGARRAQLPARTDLAGRQPSAGPRARRCGPRAHRDRAGADRRTGLRVLLPHRVRRGALRPRARHPLPGPRLGGQLRGLLLPVHHRGLTGEGLPALRALYLPRARRAAGHRRGLRARAPRGGHPVHLR
jgi:hypothetical protein